MPAPASGLATHPDVAKIAFTGSTATGRRIVEYSASNLKRVQLELGGKGANIVFDDAVIPAAVGGSAFAIFHNQGQACIAGSRLLLHERIADEFLERFVALAKSIKLGNPLDPETEMGPLTSPMHRDRVLSYVKVAIDEGGEIITGGKAPDDPSLANGCYIEPTVVRAKPGDRVCQEEVFGPFVSVSTFASEDEALAIANGTEYGLGGGLWTQNLSRAHRLAGAMRSGMVWVNSYKRVSPASPFGGTGLSGYGREMGFEAIREYTEAKSIWINVDAKIPPWYAEMIVSLREAVAEHVHDGDMLALEGFTHLIPHATGHEIIRQGRRNLHVVRMTPDLVYDQLIGSGCVTELTFSWGGNPGVGSLQRFRDAVENGWPHPLEIEEHSHAGMATRYAAGAAGLPFGDSPRLRRHRPARSTPRRSRPIECPFTGEVLAAVPAINPDVGIIHAQRADRAGNVQIWGLLGVQKEAVLAFDTIDRHRGGDRRRVAGGGRARSCCRHG